MTVHLANHRKLMYIIIDFNNHLDSSSENLVKTTGFGKNSGILTIDIPIKLVDRVRWH